MKEAVKIIWDARAAIESDDLSALQKIVKQFPDLVNFSINGEIGYRALIHIAAGCGNLEACQILKNTGSDIDEEAPREAYITPLVEAASNGHADIIVWLLQNGARVDGSPRCPTSPLLNAVRFGYLEVVKLLVKNNADINRIHDNLNQTSTDLAKTWGHAEVLDFLIGKGGNPILGENSDWGRYISGGVGAYVNDTAGMVLSPAYGWKFDEYFVNLRISNIDGKWRYKLIFTMGLSELLPRVELFICVTSNWPINRSAEFSGDEISFPMKILHVLTNYVIKGGAINEGFVLKKEDDLAAQLIWPNGYSGVVAVDYIWNKNKKTIGTEKNKSDDVKLLLLVPLKESYGDSVYKEAQLSKIIIKKKSSRWNDVALSFD